MQFLDLKNQVLNDINRVDQTSAVSSALSSAIDYYTNERWWFLEGRAYASTSSSQAFMSVPLDMQDADSLLITVNGSRSKLQQVPYNEIDEEDDGTTFGEPVKWSYYQDNVRLYPVPDAAYVLTMSYHKKLTYSDSSSNAWTNVGRNLVRHRAAKEVQQVITKDLEGAKRAEEMEYTEYMKLLGMNIKRLTTGYIKKAGW